MADDDTSTDETTESPKVDAEPVTPAPVAPDAATEPAPAAPAVPTTPAGRPPVDRRSLGLGALAVGARVLAFLLGVAAGGHHGEGGRSEKRDGRGPFAPGGGGEIEGGRGFHGGGPGMQGGMQGGMRGDMRGGMPGGGSGERGFMGRGGHGGGAGVVESASDDELTVAPLGGRIEELTVKLDDDTEVKVRGDDGADDLEDAEASDIDEGDIVMVLGAPGDVEDGDDEDAATTATIDAKAVVILRNGDE